MSAGWSSGGPPGTSGNCTFNPAPCFEIGSSSGRRRFAQPSGSSGAGAPGENLLLSSVITHTPVVFRPCAPTDDELAELLSELDESVSDDDELLELDTVAAATVWGGLSLCVAR